MKIGFTNLSSQKINKNAFIIPQEFTNAICYGQTGSGKTSSFILPNIKERMKAGHLLVIYAYKGNFHAQIKALASECGRLNDIVEIGVPWGAKINLLGSCQKNDIEKWYKRLNKSSDNYWANSSYAVFEALYDALEAISQSAKHNFSNMALYDYQYFHVFRDFEKAATFRDILKIASADKITEFAQSVLMAQNILTQVCEKGYKCYFGRLSKITKSYEFLLDFASGLVGCSAGHGNKATIETLSNTLGALNSSECLNGGVALENLLSKKAIVIIHADAIGLSAAELLNTAISRILISRLGKNDKLIPATIFIDEAHKVLNPNFELETSVCRESRFEYILSSQNSHLMSRALGGCEFFESAEQNIAYKSSFYSPDFCENLKPFEMLFLANSKSAGVCAINENPIFHKEKELIRAQKEHFKQSRILENFIITDVGSHEKIEYIKPCNDEHKGIVCTKNAQIQSEILSHEEYENIMKDAQKIEQCYTDFNDDYYEMNNFGFVNFFEDETEAMMQSAIRSGIIKFVQKESV